MWSEEAPARGNTEDDVLRRLVGTVSAMLAYWDAGQRCRFANHAYQRWFGVSAEALIGKHASELLGPLYALDLPSIEGALRGEPQQFERELPDPAGGPPRHMLTSYFPDVADGVVRGLFVHVTDVTERRRIELEQEILAEAGVVLASSLDYTRTLKSIAELVVRHTADLCVVDMVADDDHGHRITAAHADPTKAAACRALARSEIDHRQTLARSAIETGQPQIFDDITPELMASATRNAAHLEVLRQLAPRSAMVVPLVVADRVLGAVCFVSSRPRRYGQRDLGFATELARRAALAIENARLYEAARRATQARDDLLGIVAHDVRSPLNAICLAAELLHRRLETSGLVDGEAQVASILRSTARANRLIEDLLDVTRIENGALTIRCSALAAKPAVADALDSQRGLAASSAIELRLEVDEELSEIWADRDRVLQVIENLVGNALKFTPKGGRITVAATGQPDEVLFSVADTGPGIPPDNLPYVFDRFWQAARAKRQGAGLGLPICKGIVEAHGGRIWVESTVGAGTRVFFTLPTAAGPATTKAVSTTSPTVGGNWKLARP
jgi:PAS domain S-box-containing protein